MTDTHIQLAIGLCVAFVGVVLKLACEAWDSNRGIRRKR